MMATTTILPMVAKSETMVSAVWPQPLLLPSGHLHIVIIRLCPRHWAELIVPEDADVAGAVGAAAGLIRQRAIVTVTQPTDGVFRVHGFSTPEDFNAMEIALNHAEDIPRPKPTAKPKLPVQRISASMLNGISKLLTLAVKKHSLSRLGSLASRQASRVK